MSDFELREDENGIGKVLILKGEWSDEYASYMQKNEIHALRLSDGTGFEGRDISFLATLSFLRSLEVYCWEAKGIKVIESLPQLEVLGLQCKSAQRIDFSNFSHLRVALVCWSKGFGSLLALNSIEVLNVRNYPHDNLEPISSMRFLRKLYLTSRKMKSLEGIEALANLELLDLYNCPFLESLAGIECCSKLEQIEVEACNRVREQQDDL